MQDDRGARPLTTHERAQLARIDDGLVHEPGLSAALRWHGAPTCAPGRAVVAVGLSLACTATGAAAAAGGPLLVAPVVAAALAAVLMVAARPRRECGR